MIQLPSAGIYAIQNLDNGRIYVGGSVDVDRRVKVHQAHLARGQSDNPRIRQDIITYGPTVFRISILQRTFSTQELAELEQLWADRLGAFETGYNVRRIDPINHLPRLRKPRALQGAK